MLSSALFPRLTAGVLALSLGTAGAASSAPQDLPSSRVVTYLNGESGWFVCDGIDSPTISVLGWPAAGGRSRLTTYSKRSGGGYTFQNYRVGPGDPGAGQIHYPLTLAKGSTTPGGVPYNVASFNTGILDHPEQALTPPILSVTSAESDGQCRWELNTRLLGFSSRRSVQITQGSGGLTYQTWNFTDAARSRVVNPDGVQRTSVPSLSISGGLRLISNTQESFVFQNAGYTYTVRVARQGQPGAASITVSKAGKVLQTEALTGYTYAVKK